VGHSILVACWHVLSKGVPYEDLGADWFIRRRPDAHARRLARQIEALGFNVTIIAHCRLTGHAGASRAPDTVS
jgi:hypothetical protein